MKTLLLLLLLSLSAAAQTVATTADGRKVLLNADGTWKYATEKPSGAATLSLEAAIVFKSGDVKPVARASFSLLDDDLATILTNAGLTAPRSVASSDPRADLVRAFGHAPQLQILPEFAAFYAAAKKAIEPHIVSTTTTDFTGKAAFPSVPAKSYYLLGVHETPRGFVIWNLPVVLKPGANTLTLDQNNAAYAL